MDTLNEIRVVAFQEGDKFVAQALEVDVCAQGNTPDEALKRLKVALKLEAMEAVSEGRSILDLGPAPQPFHVLYDNSNVTRTLAKVA